MSKKNYRTPEQIVCSECSQGNRQLFHINGTYICKKCLEKQGKEDSPEMTERKNEIREAFYRGTFGGGENK